MPATVFANAHVITFDPARPRAGALAFEHGLVTALADDARELRGKVLDLAGAWVLPGLSDAHLHLQSIGAWNRQLDLRGASLEAVEARVRERHAQLPAESWLIGRGWNQNLWPGAEYPSWALLERAAPGRPVALTRVDGHASWVSRAALERAGIDRNAPDPPGGSILRDEQGEPTGVLLDLAMELVSARVPQPSRAELRTELLSGLEAVAAVGLTSVHDMGTTPEMASVLEDLEHEGLLPVRVWAHLLGPLDELRERMAAPHRGPLYREAGVKLFADGALGSHGALLLCPYCDRPSEHGLALMEPEELASAASSIHAAGLQIAIHAIGDLANRRALDAIARAQGADRSRRHRVEHAQILAPEELARFAELGVTASMQPSHAASDAPWAEARLGPERMRGAYAWRSVLETGALVAFGSDAPIEHENPWLGVAAAVTRPGLAPRERLGLAQALDAFVRGPALAVHAPLPVIRPGAPADFSLIDRDPFATADSGLALVRPLGTWVAGRDVTPGRVSPA